jgi:hypothetical protein
VITLRLALNVVMQNNGDFVDVILIYPLNLSKNFVAPTNLNFPDRLTGTVWERSEPYHFVFPIIGQGP